MNNVFVKLYSYLPSGTDAEQNIINYLINHSEKVINMNIRQLANVTYTSPSTIIRLAKKLSYEGFSDLKNALIYDMAIRDQNKEQLVQDVEPDDDLDTIIEKVTMRNIISLQNTEKLLNKDYIAKSVRLMEDARNINLFGMGSSLLVAKDTSLKFLRINKQCNVFDDWHTQLIMAKNTKADDLGIIFSYSGKTEEMIKCAETIKQNGAKIILITGFENSPISKYADVILNVAATEYLFRSGAMSSRISQMNVVDILYTAYINNNYDDSVKRISITHIKKYGEEEN